MRNEIGQRQHGEQRHGETPQRQRAHRLDHQTTPPIAITVSGSTMTINDEEPAALRRRQQDHRRHGDAGADGGAALLAGEPAHRRHQQVAVRHVGQEGVAGEVAVADHHGPKRRRARRQRAPRPRSPARAAAPSGTWAAAAPAGALDRARIRGRHRPRIAVAAALEDRRHLHAGRRLASSVSGRMPGKKVSDRVRVIGCGS